MIALKIPLLKLITLILLFIVDGLIVAIFLSKIFLKYDSTQNRGYFGNAP